MGLKEAWTALFNSAPTNTRATKEGPIVAYSNVGTRVASKDRYDDLAKDGYMQNAIVYRCVNEIAQGAASVKFELKMGDQPITESPILDILKRPNPMSNGSEFFQEVYSYLLLSGNSFIMKTGPDDGDPKELYTLRPDRIQIIPSKRDIPERFDYIVNGQTAASYPVGVDGESDVKQIKLFNPLNDFYGLSPVRPAAVDIDQHNLSNKHNVALLMNGARPSGAVVYKPKDEAGNMTMLTEAQRDALRQDLSQRFERTENTGRTMILEGDFDYKEMGMTPKDMDFSGMKNMAARDIALCFGVPAQLVGIPDSQTYANMAEARLALYEETIIPMLRHVESDLNEWLVSAFGEPQLTLSYVIDDIPAISERRRMIYDNVIRAVDTGILTRNEARKRLSLEPLSGGDDAYIPANLFPLGQPEPNPPQPQSEDDAEKIAEEIYGDALEKRLELHLTREQAETRASQIGCVGTHTHEINGVTYYMPCSSHEDFHSALGITMPKQKKTLKTVSETTIERLFKYDGAKPTQGMEQEAERSLQWVDEFDRGGTRVGRARARQIANNETLNRRDILDMYSFFSRHEVDKQAEGFNRGEKGYPSNGRIAWGLWGGDAGFRWSTKERDKIMKEENKSGGHSSTEKTNGAAAFSKARI